MTISGELKNLEKVQARLVRFCSYLEKQERTDGTNSYDDLYRKIANVVGSIEEAITFDDSNK